MGDTSPVIAGTALGKPASMASLEIVWWELEVAIILVKICLKLVVSVLFRVSPLFVVNIDSS